MQFLVCLFFVFLPRSPWDKSTLTPHALFVGQGRRVNKKQGPRLRCR